MRFLNESAAAGSREKGCECHDRACRGQVMRTACIEYLVRPMQPLGCSEPLIGTMHEPGMPFLQNTNNQRVTLFEGVKPSTAAPQQQIRMMLDQYSDARPVLLWGLKQLPPGSAIACCHGTVSLARPYIVNIRFQGTANYVRCLRQSGCCYGCPRAVQLSLHGVHSLCQFFLKR